MEFIALIKKIISFFVFSMKKFFGGSMFGAIFLPAKSLKQILLKLFIFIFSFGRADNISGKKENCHSSVIFFLCFMYSSIVWLIFSTSPVQN